MSTITIYRKKDGKAISCDMKQLPLFTSGDDALYSTKFVESKTDDVNQDEKTDRKNKK